MLPFARRTNARPVGSEGGRGVAGHNIGTFLQRARSGRGCSTRANAGDRAIAAQGGLASLRVALFAAKGKSDRAERSVQDPKASRPRRRSSWAARILADARASRGIAGGKPGLNRLKTDLKSGASPCPTYENLALFPWVGFHAPAPSQARRSHAPSSIRMAIRRRRRSQRTDEPFRRSP